MHTRSVVLGLLLVAVFTATSFAGDTVSARYKTSTPERHRVTEELSYYFQISTYEPPVEVKLSETQSFATPEEAAMSMLSSMAKGDYDHWLSGWTEASQKMLLDEDKKHNRDSSFWKTAWANVMSGKKIELTRRIETGDYVLIVYKVSDPKAATKGQDFETRLVFVKDKTRWVATQDLASDPVLLNWQQPDSVIRRTIRSH